MRSVITSPDADPHNDEPTAADGRTVANAQYVVENGAGYDPWIAKLVAANPAPARSVLNVGELVGVCWSGGLARPST
jgi:zinc/manganese transport system substrate-binding protein